MQPKTTVKSFLFVGSWVSKTFLVDRDVISLVASSGQCLKILNRYLSICSCDVNSLARVTNESNEHESLTNNDNSTVNLTNNQIYTRNAQYI